MTDNMNLNADISVKVSAKQLPTLVNTLAELQKVGGKAGKALNDLERDIVAADAAAKKFGNLSQIKAQEKAFASYSQNIRVASQTQRDLKKAQDDAFASYSSNIRTSTALDRQRTEVNRAHGQAIRQNAAIEQQAANQRQTIVRANAAAIRMDTAMRNQAAAQAQRAAEREVSNMARQRYALYDVASTYGVVATAALGAATATAAVGIAFERQFADVIRTSGVEATAEVENLRLALTELTTSMPIAFGEVAQIATIGGQLGVAKEDITEFTDSIARFSAVTGVTAEQSSKMLGRLAQMTKTPISDIENLSSAMYQTGVNAIATEADILSISSQIATAGDLAGFSAAEIIALSSAFASLGIAPERARGSVQRIFGQIEKSVSGGGEALEAFASLSGMAAEDFATAWNNTPQVAFSSFIEGLNRASAAGEDTNQMLKDLGVGAVRDIQSLQALANNTDVYTAALKDSNEGFQTGQATIDGYAIIADTAAAKLQQLLNAAKALLAAMNQNGAIKAFAAALTDIITTATAFMETDIGGAVALIGLALTAGAGLFFAYRSAVALTTASVYALRVAQSELLATSGRSAIGLRALVTELFTYGRSADAATASTARLAAAQTAAGGAAGRMAAGTTAASTAAAAASRSTGMWVGLLKNGLIGAGIVGGLYGLAKVYEQVSDAQRSASEVALDYYGNTAGLAEALRGDTEKHQEYADAIEAGKDAVDASGQVISTFGVTVSETSTSASDAVGNFEAFAGAQSDLAGAGDVATATLERQRVVVADLTKEWALNALTTGESGKAFFDYFKNNQAAIAEMGLDFNELLTAALDPAGGGATAMLDAKMQELRDTIGKTMSLQEFAVNDQVEALNGLYAPLEGLTALIKDQGLQSQITGQVAEALGVDLSHAGEGADEFADGLEGAASAGDNFKDSMQSSVGSIADVQAAFFALGESIATNGTSFDAFSEAGRANLDALESTVNSFAEAAGDDTAAFTSNIALMLAELQNAGVDTQGELGFVADQLTGLTNSEYGINLDTSIARTSISAFITDAIKALETVAALEKRNATLSANKFLNATGVANRKNSGVLVDQGSKYDSQIADLKRLQTEVGKAGTTGNKSGKSFADGFDKARQSADKAGKSAGGAGKKANEAAVEFRSLVDYASDLRSVTDRAFEIRFSVSQAQDDVANIYDNIAKSAKDAADAVDEANQKLREIDASIAELRASNKTLEYQLSVAIEYGDTLRESEIRAQLGKNNAEISGKGIDRGNIVDDLTAAQAETSMALTGNTAAARQNRATVEGLTQAYQKEIIALAQSGASTDVVAARTAELRAEFVRQLTQMGFNRAEVERYAVTFDDLTAALNRVPRNVTVTANTNPAQQAIEEFIARNANRSIGVSVSAPSSIGGGTYNASGINVGSGGITTPAIAVGAAGIAAGAALGLFRKSGGPVPEYHAVGGMAGAHPGSPKGSDTVPAWLTPEEFVVQKKASNYYGTDYMNALNNMQIPKYLATGGSASVQRSNASRGAQSAIQLVEWLPTQLNQLINALENMPAPVISRDAIAGAANASNKQATVRSNA